MRNSAGKCPAGYDDTGRSAYMPCVNSGCPASRPGSAAPSCTTAPPSCTTAPPSCTTAPPACATPDPALEACKARGGSLVNGTCVLPNGDVCRRVEGFEQRLGLQGLQGAAYAGARRSGCAHNMVALAAAALVALLVLKMYAE